MDQIKIMFTPKANILDIWLDDPKTEAYCSETDGDVIIRKNKEGRVIGFEILNFLSPRQLKAGLPKFSPEISILDAPG